MADVKIDDLAKAVQGELDAFVGMIPSAFAEAGKAAGKKAAKNLRSSSPKKTGEYSKGWKVKTTTTRTGATTTVYNGRKPTLTHLLEYGHPIVSGGRIVGQAKAFPHLADAQSQANADFVDELQKRLENDT